MELAELVVQIQSRLREIRFEVEEACQKAGRSADEVRILAISKRQSVEVIRAAHSLGITSFGESYVQEALEKMSQLSDLQDLHWEMVGHVQSRKAKQVSAHFDRLHSLDSLKLAELLSNHRPEGMKPLEVYLEVNLAGEESKSGFDAKDQTSWPALVPAMEKIQTLKGIKLTGLMAMPPLFEDAQLRRPYFIKLRQLKEYLNKSIHGLNLIGLSAGTSHDFAIAIQEGATVIRIGERLLGPRNYQK